MADSVGGGDVENREKSRRGTAYQCMHCYHKEGQKFIDVKYRNRPHSTASCVFLDVLSASN